MFLTEGVDGHVEGVLTQWLDVTDLSQTQRRLRFEVGPLDGSLPRDWLYERLELLYSRLDNLSNFLGL